MDHRFSDASVALDMIERGSSVSLRLAYVGGVWTLRFAAGNFSAYGYRREDFLDGGVDWMVFIHPDDRKPQSDELRRFVTAGGGRYTTAYRVLAKNGQIMWVTDTRILSHDADGILCLDCIVSDNTEGMRVQARIEENMARQRLLNEILQRIHSGELEDAVQVILNRTGEHLGISRAVLFQDNFDHTECRTVCEWTGPGVDSVMGAKPYVLNYKQDIPELELFLNGRGMRLINAGEIPGNSASAFWRGGVAASAVFTVYLAGEKYGFIRFDECARPRVWEAETVAFLSTMAFLMSTALVRKSHEDAILHMAHHDRLTDLTNRYRFDTMLDTAILRARKAEAPGYVFFIDMDDFKIINEGYGHEYGDALLIAVAGYLQTSFSGCAHLFRFGGDEFTVLVDHEHGGRANTILDALMGRARQPWQVMDREFYCTISVGVVRFPDGGVSPTEVTKNADIALYRAKSTGKNNYVLYNEKMHNESVQRAETEHKMREAIENEFAGFRVYYQPIVDLDGTITGAEALIRWMDAAGNLTPPGKFIPLAEYLGLIVPLGEFVLREAALFCARMNEALPDFTVNVNISIRQFQQHDFLTKVEKTLAAAGVNGANMVLEITEGMMVQDMEHMQMMTEQLRGMGMRVAMDDFGTGYSSLSNMRTMPLDIIKIDRSFIRDVTSDAYAKSFIHLITDLVHSMGRTVCVEGVETAVQYRYCAECGVDKIQGFYFYRPMPANQLRRLLLSDPSQMATTDASRKNI